MEGGRQATLRGVLFTDMVGSSQLRSRLGDDRADALRRDHNALLGSAVTAHGGRVLRWTGDGIKADFPTASAALSAALEMQRSVTAYGRAARAVAPFEIRIGVSAGEVVVEGNEAHGIAVIEAARLEPLADPGGVLATDLAQRLAQRRVDAAFEEVGSFTLKGLDEPVTVVRVLDRTVNDDDRPLPRSLVTDRRFPLVGRTAEVQRVLDAWGEARGGMPATVFVAGAAGIGKSRLVAQVADRAHADGAVVLAGTCDSDLAVPYEPFALAFAEVAGSDEELGRAVAAGTGALGPLFPGHRRDRGEDGGAADRFELFEAVVALVDRLARDQPLVLVLDDLHWATAPTIQLLRHVVRRSERAPLLVLASYRPDEVGDDHPLHPVLGERPTVGTSTVVRLDGLTPTDLAELVSARVPAAPVGRIQQFARRVHEESAGSPFFACELLEHLTATGELADLVNHGDSAVFPLPDSVREVVSRRLARLPADAAELLTTAAVVGAAFDLELVAELCGLTAAEALDRCEDLARLSLLQEVGPGRFAFSHALVRTTVLERLSASRRAFAHRQVAEAIDARGGADHDELAHHWTQAGVEDRAFASLEQAAERDLEAFAFESALERYRDLLDYHRDDPTGDAAARARAWLGLGRAHRALGVRSFLAEVGEAGKLARRLHDVDLLTDAALAAIWPGNFYVTAGDIDIEKVELAEDALALLPADDPRRARVLATLASLLTFDPDRSRRVALLGEAEALARQVGDPELIGTVLVTEHLALWHASTADRRAQIGVEVGRLARASGDVTLEFFGGFLPAFSALEHGRMDEVRSRIERLDEPVTATQNPYFAFLTERLGVTVDVFLGHPEAQSRVDALAASYDGSYADTEGTWAIQTGHLAIQAGRLGDLVPSLRPMVEGTRVNNWLTALGLALHAAGEHDQAAAVFDRMPEPPLDYFWLPTTQLNSELALALGRLDRAEGFYDDLLPYAELMGITASGSACMGFVATTLGAIALDLGRHELACDHLTDALRRAEALGAPYESTKVHRLLGRSLAALGRAAEADLHLGTARERAESHGLAGELALLAVDA